jgi:hypothetical protein
MKKLIYIKDIRHQKEVSLHMLLEDIGDIGNDYIWSILELEAVGDIGDTHTYADIDNAIKFQNGYCLSCLIMPLKSPISNNDRSCDPTPSNLSINRTKLSPLRNSHLAHRNVIALFEHSPLFPEGGIYINNRKSAGSVFA